MITGGKYEKFVDNNNHRRSSEYCYSLYNLRKGRRVNMMIYAGEFERQMKEIDENGSSSKREEGIKIMIDTLESMGYAAGLEIFKKFERKEKQ